jgi:hypothetical protein
MEDDLVATAGRDDLPIAAAKRAIRPPAVLDQPGLAHRLDSATVHHLRLTSLAGADRDAAWDR